MIDDEHEADLQEALEVMRRLREVERDGKQGDERKEKRSEILLPGNRLSATGATARVRCAR
jgi:hypothetical protein